MVRCVWLFVSKLINQNYHDLLTNVLLFPSVKVSKNKLKINPIHSGSSRDFNPNESEPSFQFETIWMNLRWINLDLKFIWDQSELKLILVENLGWIQADCSLALSRIHFQPIFIKLHPKNFLSTFEIILKQILDLFGLNFFSKLSSRLRKGWTQIT